MRKQREDEIPLTFLKPSIIQETKARFDSLLRSTLNNRGENRVKNVQKVQEKKPEVDPPHTDGSTRPSRKRQKWKLSTSTQKLLSQDEETISSNEDMTDDGVSKSPSKDSTIIHTPVHQTSRTSSSSTLDTPFHSPKGASSLSEDCSYAPDIQESFDNNSQKSLSPTLPLVPFPLPRTAQSIRDESRETTSSRLSSPDSVKTAIEALTPSKSAQSFNEASLERSADSGDMSDFQLKEYRKKTITALSPSYEEIDESSFELNQVNDSASKIKLNRESKKAMQNAVSYEEISEENLSLKSVPNFQSITESTEGSSEESEMRNKRRSQRDMSASHKEKIKIKSRKTKLLERKLKTEIDSDDSSYAAKKPGSRRRNQKDSMGSRLPPNGQFAYKNIIGVIIHYADALKVASKIHHPMVRVHFIDTLTGEYLKKSQADRNVSFYYENSNVDFIQPLTCSPCSFKDPRSLTPIWEETLIFNEDMEHILTADSAILIFFEVLDVVSLEVGVAQYDKLGPSCCWHRIAWAFLKPCGANNVLNINKRIRLQLYKPRAVKAKFINNRWDRCDVYQWWCKGGWVKYPSTLHVSVQSMSAMNFQPAVRSYFALQPEEVFIKSTFQAMPDNSNSGINASSDIVDGRTTDGAIEKCREWMRLPSQSCKIPNKTLLNLPAGVNGCFSLKFSSQGKFLAFSAINNNMHFVHIYQVPSGVEEIKFQGHLGLIYCLEWSLNDELLVTASADCTACVWSFKSRKSAPLHILPHPSFVYCAVFVEQGNALGLVTGCSDHILRFWRAEEDSKQFQLMQEMNGHNGFVSSLCHSLNSSLLSGDSVGEIRVWNRTDNKYLWKCDRTMNIRELKGVVISQMILHPSGKRMLVHARDSLLRMVDISTGVPIQWFKGALNHHIHSGACISPCGGLVFSASEDGHFCVWDVDTGVLQATYSSVFSPKHQSEPVANRYNFQKILSGSVVYHPLKHLAAFASYGSQVPVAICVYDRDSNGKEIGLKCFSETGPSSHSDKTSLEAQPAPVSKQTIQLDIATQRQTSRIRSFSESRDSVRNVHEEIREEQSKHLSKILMQLDTVLHLSMKSKTKQSHPPTSHGKDSPDNGDARLTKTPIHSQKSEPIKHVKNEESRFENTAELLPSKKSRHDVQTLEYVYDEESESDATYSLTSKQENDIQSGRPIIPSPEIQSDSSSNASYHPEDALTKAPNLGRQSVDEKSCEVAHKASHITVVQSKKHF